MKYFSSDFFQFKNEKNLSLNEFLACSKRKNQISMSSSSEQEESVPNFQKLKISVSRIFQNAIESIESALFNLDCIQTISPKVGFNSLYKYYFIIFLRTIYGMFYILFFVIYRNLTPRFCYEKIS